MYYTKDKTQHFANIYEVLSYLYKKQEITDAFLVNSIVFPDIVSTLLDEIMLKNHIIKPDAYEIKLNSLKLGDWFDSISFKSKIVGIKYSLDDGISYVVYELLNDDETIDEYNYEELLEILRGDDEFAKQLVTLKIGDYLEISEVYEPYQLLCVGIEDDVYVMENIGGNHDKCARFLTHKELRIIWNGEDLENNTWKKIIDIQNVYRGDKIKTSIIDATIKKTDWNYFNILVDKVNDSNFFGIEGYEYIFSKAEMEGIFEGILPTNDFKRKEIKPGEQFYYKNIQGTIVKRYKIMVDTVTEHTWNTKYEVRIGKVSTKVIEKYPSKMIEGAIIELSEEDLVEIIELK